MTLPIQEIVLAPREGNRFTIGSSEVTFKAVGADTHGHLSLFKNLIYPEGTAPGVHIHRHIEEMFYVLEGEVEILVGEFTSCTITKKSIFQALLIFSSDAPAVGCKGGL